MVIVGTTQIPSPVGQKERTASAFPNVVRSEEHTSELQSLAYLVCRLLLEKKKRPRLRPERGPEMRVGLNAEPLFQRIPTGVGVYALALCRGLIEIGHGDELVIFHAAHDEVPPEVGELSVERVGFTLSRDRLYDAWMSDRRPAPQSITEDLDVVHSTGPAIPPPGGAALVVTVHDLAPIRFAD